MISEEVAEENTNIHPTVVRRENDGELHTRENFSESYLDETIINRKITDLNVIDSNYKHEVMFPDNAIEVIGTGMLKIPHISEGMLWHKRLGHASLGYLKQLQKMDESLKNINFDKSILDCQSCILAKMKNLPYNEVRTRAEKSLQRSHTDLMGPIKPASYPGGARFIISFVDDYSRFAKLYCIRSKSEAGLCLEKFLQTSRCQPQRFAKFSLDEWVHHHFVR